jgi:hypothetical protein
VYTCILLLRQESFDMILMTNLSYQMRVSQVWYGYEILHAIDVLAGGYLLYSTCYHPYLLLYLK